MRLLSLLMNSCIDIGKRKKNAIPKLKFEDLQLAECWVLNMIEFVESIMEDDNNEG